MPFVDGEPIDAAKLGKIETELNLLKSQIPKFGGSDTNILLTPSTSGDVVSTGPEIQAVQVEGFDCCPGATTKTVTFPKAFSKTPVVVVGLRRGSSTTENYAPAVQSKSVGTKGFTIVVNLPKGKTATMGVNYIAIAY